MKELEGSFVVTCADVAHDYLKSKYMEQLTGLAEYLRADGTTMGGIVVRAEDLNRTIWGYSVEFANPQEWYDGRRVRVFATTNGVFSVAQGCEVVLENPRRKK